MFAFDQPTRNPHHQGHQHGLRIVRHPRREHDARTKRDDRFNPLALKRTVELRWHLAGPQGSIEPACVIDQAQILVGPRPQAFERPGPIPSHESAYVQSLAHQLALLSKSPPRTRACPR